MKIGPNQRITMMIKEGVPNSIGITYPPGTLESLSEQIASQKIRLIRQKTPKFENATLEDTLGVIHSPKIIDGMLTVRVQTTKTYDLMISTGQLVLNSCIAADVENNLVKLPIKLLFTFLSPKEKIENEKASVL